MNVREKLIEIVCDAMERDGCIGHCNNSPCFEVERVINALIANGVTVQEWISVNDKLPPYNRDVLVYRPNMAMKILVDTYDGYYGDDDDEWYEGWALYGKDIHGKPVITHWAYLPQPPKGE